MAGLPKIDWANVIRGVWDSDNQAIRTTMQAIVATGSMEVSIDAAQDSIRLGDGSLLNTLTASGGKNGVDVNVIAPITVNGVVGVSGTTAVSGSLGRTWTLDSSTDSVSAAQLGTWNLNSITGTVSLPTNAAQEASGHLEAIDNKLNSLGQKAMTGSVPVVIASDQSTVSISGLVSADQSGVWNINNVSGTISLPTNAAQEASGHLESIDAKFNSLGQKPSTGSVPVVIASDQSTVSISGLVSADQSGIWNINNVSGTVSLPTNAAQETGGHLEFIDAKLNSLGQKTSTGSVPVVIASDQSTVSISGLVSAEQSGIWNINNVSGVISLPTGAATEATLAKLTQTQGSATTGQSGPLVQGAVSTSPPIYVTDTTDPFSLTVSGSLRSDLSSIAGNLVDTGNGIAGVGVQRVVVASDNDAFAVSALQNGTWTVQQGTPPWQVVGNISSASADSGNPVKIGAVYNSALPTASTGQRVDAQADVNGRQYVTNVPLDGAKTTYSAAINGLVAAATPTDIFTITGSATKTVRILRIHFSGTQNTSGARDVLLLKRSTANTGGTSSTPTVVPHDSANSAGTAVVRAYTANPTLGSLVGIVRAERITLLATNVTNPLSNFTWDFGVRPSQALVLRGTSEMVAINLNSVTSSNNLLAIDIEWSEET